MEVVVGFALGGAIVKKDDADTAANLELLPLNHKGFACRINNFFSDLSDLEARCLPLGAQPFEEHNKFITTQPRHSFLSSNNLTQALSK